MQMNVYKDGKNNLGYNLYNNSTLIAEEGLSWADAMQFPGDNESPKFKFVLNGDHLYMYINDEEDEWTNVVKDWTGLTSSGPGYFGMYVNSNGNSSTVLSTFTSSASITFARASSALAFISCSRATAIARLSSALALF